MQKKGEKSSLLTFGRIDYVFKRLFKSEAEVNITINQIVKIGTDVILVEL